MESPILTNPNVKLHLKIENFGPITSGTIDIKPLTVFTGDNNSGKSYAALLIHSIIDSERRLISELGRRHSVSLGNKMKNQLTNLNDLSTHILDFNMHLDADVPATKLQHELRKNFSAKISKLIQIGQDKCDLDIASNLIKSKVKLSSNSISVFNDIDLNMPIEINLAKNAKPISIKNKTVIISKDHISELFSRGRNYAAWEIIARYCSTYTLNSNYLPASRYGILQGHRAISAGIVDSASLAGIEDIHIPKLSGAVSSFLRNLLQMPGSLGPCKIIAKNFERIIRGNILIQDSKLGSEIKYLFHKRRIPMQLSSSTVSEIAPIVLYLKYLIHPNSFLVIEEPESHLHPDNQIKVAQCIIELVRMGVYVLITTHSPYLLEPLGNFLKASRLSKLERERTLNNCSECYIKPNELAVYSFENDRDFSVVKDVFKSPADGIHQEKFLAAFRSINKQARAIDEYNEFT